MPTLIDRLKIEAVMVVIAVAGAVPFASMLNAPAAHTPWYIVGMYVVLNAVERSERLSDSTDWTDKL